MKYVKECCRNTEGHPGPRFPISTSHGDVFHLKRKFQQKVWFKSVPTQPRTVCLDKHRSQMGEIVGVLEPRWGHLPLSVRVWGRYCCLKQPWMFALRLVHKREESLRAWLKTRAALSHEWKQRHSAPAGHTGNVRLRHARRVCPSWRFPAWQKTLSQKKRFVDNKNTYKVMRCVNDVCGETTHQEYREMLLLCTVQ